MEFAAKPTTEWSSIPLAWQAMLQGQQEIIISLLIICISVVLGLILRRILRSRESKIRNGTALLPTMIASFLGACLLLVVALQASSGSKVDSEANTTNLINSLRDNYGISVNNTPENRSKLSIGEDFAAVKGGKSVNCSLEYDSTLGSFKGDAGKTITFRPHCS